MEFVTGWPMTEIDPGVAVLHARPVARAACCLICAMALILTQPSNAEVEKSFAANDVEFLNLMGNLEAPRGFGTVSDFAPWCLTAL